MHRSAYLVAILASSLGGTAAAQSSYDLVITAERERASVTVGGVWIWPVQEQASAEPEFRLSRVMRSLRVLWMQCGPDPVSVLSSERRSDGGDDLWRLRLSRACPKGQPLRMAFQARSEGKAPQFRVGATDGFATGGGELWYPQRTFADRDTGTLTLDLPRDLTGIATGVEVGRETRADRTRLRFESRVPGKLAFAFGRYKEARVVAPFPVRVLTFADDVSARDTADALSRSLAPLAEAFGPSPVAELAAVEVDFQSQVAGTSEYGMIFAEPGKFRGGFDLPYWAHEFGHQWWGNSVRAARPSTGATLLTEGLAQYGALHALERVEGPETAARYRRDGRNGRIREALAGYRELVASGRDRPAAGAWVTTGNQEDILLAHRLAVSKGALLLDQLARRMGRERLHAVLRRFHAQHAGKAAIWAELEAELRATAGLTLAAEIRAWFSDPGVPPPLKAELAALEPGP